MKDSIRTPLTPLDYFSLLTADEKHLPLIETLASIAQIAYRDLKLSSIEDEFDLLSSRIRAKVTHDASALQKIWLLNHFLYEELRFRSIASTKESPDFSCINKVLKDGVGTDYILTAIYLELAAVLRLKAKGVMFPGRFFIKISFRRNNNVPVEVIIDPRTGLSLSMKNFHGLLDTYKQKNGLVDEFDIPTDLFLEPATKKELLAGVLADMRDAYLEEENWPRLTKTFDYLIALNPRHIENYRERGFALIRQGLKYEAVNDLEYYLQHVPSQSRYDTDYVFQQIQLLKNSF